MLALLYYEGDGLQAGLRESSLPSSVLHPADLGTDRADSAPLAFSLSSEGEDRMRVR